MENQGSEFGTVPQTILIVEDEALVRLDAAESLRQGGYRVREAAKGHGKRARSHMSISAISGLIAG